MFVQMDLELDANLALPQGVAPFITLWAYSGRVMCVCACIMHANIHTLKPLATLHTLTTTYHCQISYIHTPQHRQHQLQHYHITPGREKADQKGSNGSLPGRYLPTVGTTPTQGRPYKTAKRV